MVRVNKEQATTNYFKSIVGKTKWGQTIRVVRDNEGVQDNCSDTSKRVNSNLVIIIQIFQILMHVNFKIIGLKWQEQYWQIVNKYYIINPSEAFLENQRACAIVQNYIVNKSHLESWTTESL